jgi:formyltetrahydrofolate deformylase
MLVPLQLVSFGMMSSNILLIHCPDRAGLINNITGVIYRHNLNIISNGEFVDAQNGFFFMRTEFSGELNREVFLDNLRQALPGEVSIKLSDGKKKDIVILATREHHCLSDLLVRHAFNELHANILCVISNYPTLEELTVKFNVPFHCISHENKNRSAHEQELLGLIRRYDPEFLVLAKYMRILSPAFVNQFSNRIINIHHSFLPAFIGANPYAQAFERGVKIIGATAHFVNNNLDEGPIISQNVIPVNHTHSAREMSQAGREVEKQVLANALSMVFHEQVFVFGNKTIIFD